MVLFRPAAPVTAVVVGVTAATTGVVAGTAVVTIVVTGVSGVVVVVVIVGAATLLDDVLPGSDFVPVCFAVAGGGPAAVV